MSLKNYLHFFLFFSIISFAQTTPVSPIGIADNLKEYANSVVRNQAITITISSQKSMSIRTQRTVTILNSFGLRNAGAIEYYDKSTSIKSVEATIYNSFGNEIKKYKKKDFIDQSVVDGFSVYSEQRKLFLNYIPIDYPFTIVYESVVETSNTAFIPSWSPIEANFESVEKSSVTIKYPPNLGFKYLENNFDNKNIARTIGENFLTYVAVNVPAEKVEELSPSYRKIIPQVIFGLEKFSLEGVEGNATTWKEFGNWVYSSLLTGTDELSETTKNKIRDLTKNETDTLKKAKIVYQFVQDKTRYVSIQMGIGGWKPMKASDVDRLSYGDCKALSNYTRVLLQSIGIPSFYTIIYGDDEPRNIRKDFVSIQGNHAILAIPINNKLTFLECTSQTAPFGFEGDFTDNRDALLVSENDSKIVKTNEWINKLNAQFLTAKCFIDADGNLSSMVSIKSKGLQYNTIYQIERQPKEEVDGYYKKHFSWINNLKIDKIKFNNDRNAIEFTESFQINATGYSVNNAGIMMVPVNIFNRNTNIPQRYRNRKNPIEIDRGFYDEDEVEISLPSNFKIDSKPENIEFSDKYGSYKMELIELENNKILFKRKLLINQGLYDKLDYENYRKFREQIARSDNSKIVLKAN